MAVQFISSTTAFTNPNSPIADAWRFAIPAGAVRNDVLLLVVGGTFSVTAGCHFTTSGWSTTLLYRGAAGDLVIVGAYVITGAETSPITVTASEDLGENEAIAVALLYRGAGLPSAATARSSTVSNGTGQFSFTSPSQTPGAVGDAFIGIAHINLQSGEFTSTPGSQRFDTQANDDGLAVFDLVSTTFATFGSQTALAVADSQVGSAHSFLLPASTAPPLPGGLADLALTLDNGAIDLGITADGNDLASDRGMRTAVILSLFTDRRAADDDVPPSGDPEDRRGWWADELAEVEGDRYGSRLWLLDRSKLTAETGRLAEEYVREALAWMLQDKVVSTIDVAIDLSSRRHMLIDLVLHRPGRDPLPFRFAHVWDAVAAD